MDGSEWTADALYDQRWEVWAEVESEWALAWLGRELADLGAWECAQSAGGEATIIEATRAGRPALRLRIAPLGRGTGVEAECLAHDVHAFHDFVFVYEQTARWPGARVLQGPLVPETVSSATGEPEPEAQPPAVAAQEPEPADKEQRGPSKETRRRANLFREIKTGHPRYSYAKVAQEATRQAKLCCGPGEPPPTYLAHHVRDAYRAMGWDWERADLVR